MANSNDVISNRRVSDERTYSKEFVYQLLEGVIGKTLGEVDEVASRQFDRAEKSAKITGIAGDVIEQSLFRYERDSKQECDISIDGIFTELKTTGVRVPKKEISRTKGKVWQEYAKWFGAKEGISITGVTFVPWIEEDFDTSHFWEKSEHLLIVFYEYRPYSAVPAIAYKDFHIVGYCYNRFSESEVKQLRNDWELVRDYLKIIYETYPTQEQRDSNLVGFTHKLRPNLLLIELVPGFSKKKTGGYQRPRYRLKKTFIDTIVRGHFNQTRDEVNLKESFSSFAELDRKCHVLTEKYKGKTLLELKDILHVETTLNTKDFAAKCIIKMFDANCKKLSQILDFTRAGIIPKTIRLTSTGHRTEDMKLSPIDFDEWCDRDIDFEDSEIGLYFTEHSFLCPIFVEQEENNPAKTIFQGFKRFAFDDDFIQNEVKRTWDDVRALIHQNTLEWVYDINKKTGERIKNKSGEYRGAPNFPKSSNYTVFLRGGAKDSSEDSRTEIVNNIKIIPQYFWLKGAYIADKLNTLPYL